MARCMYVDVESTGLNPRRSELRLVSINGEAYDWWELSGEGHRDIIREKLDAGKHDTLVAHNAQFDLDFLAEHVGYHHEGPVFDTMVALQLLQNGRRDPDNPALPKSANLETACRTLLGVQLDKQFQKGPWDGMLFDDQLQYAADDTKYLAQLHEILSKALDEARLTNFMTMEMQLLPILLEARRRGILLDADAARKLLDDTKKEVNEIAAELPANLNPRAPEQVAKFFGLPDSKEDTLREYKWKLRSEGSNPTTLAQLENVMKARKKMKRASSVKKQLLKRIEYDGRIHTSFKQTSTETGRLSSSEPNLQNQDRGPEVRGLFVPMAGNKFVIADYAQLEVRIAALVSGDRALRRVFEEGRDIHSETCAAIFGEETKATRTLSKNILFGSLFGGGHSTVVRFAAKSDVHIEPKEAKEYQKAFFAKYPTLKKWHEKAGDTRPKYVYSMLGRRRYIQQGEAYCTRINNRIQSTAADGMKIAMIRLRRHRGILPLLNVHDEVIVEVPEDEAEETRQIVEDEMVASMYRATLQKQDKPIVPIAVEAGVADSWAEK